MNFQIQFDFNRVHPNDNELDAPLLQNPLADLDADLEFDEIIDADERLGFKDRLILNLLNCSQSLGQILTNYWASVCNHMTPFFCYEQFPPTFKLVFFVLQILAFSMTNAQLSKTASLLKDEDLLENFPYHGNRYLNTNFCIAFDFCRQIYGYLVVIGL